MANKHLLTCGPVFDLIVTERRYLAEQFTASIHRLPFRKEYLHGQEKQTKSNTICVCSYLETFAKHLSFVTR